MVSVGFRNLGNCDSYGFVAAIEMKATARTLKVDPDGVQTCRYANDHSVSSLAVRVGRR